MDATNLLHSKLCGEVSVLVFVAAVAIDLAADFTTGPSGAVNVNVSGARPNRLEQFVKFSSANAAFISKISNVGCRDRA